MIADDPDVADEEELARRLQLLGFDDHDVACVRAVAERLDPDLPGVADALYARAATLDPLARLLDGHLDQCRVKQVTYLRELLAARPDPTYAAARSWVGLVHRRVGLPLRWYLAALSVLGELLAERLDDAFPDDPRGAWRASRALSKLLAFDAMLAVDAFVDGATSAGRAERDALRDQAAPVAFEVLPRLLVVPAVGPVDPDRSRALWGAVLRGAAAHDARAVVLDATHLATLDLDVALALLDVARRAVAAGLVAVVAGIGPRLARELERRGVPRDIPLARSLPLAVRRARALTRAASLARRRQRRRDPPPPPAASRSHGQAPGRRSTRSHP